VRGNSAPDAFDSFRCLRASAETAVEPTATIRHRWALAERTAARLRAAPWSLREIAGEIPVFQPPPPPFMGSLFASHGYPPPPDSVLPNQLRRRWPVRHGKRARV